MEPREWKPGDSLVLPEVDPSCYPPDAVELPVELEQSATDPDGDARA